MLRIRRRSPVEPSTRKRKHREQEASRRHRNLRRAGRRLGRITRRRQDALPTAGCGARHDDAAESQSARWLRLSRLRLAGPETHLLVRILRKRRQGHHLGIDGKTRRSQLLCRQQRKRSLALDGPQAGRCRPTDPSAGLRPRQRPLCADRMGRSLPLDRHRTEQAA